jgi:hypothetical protein
MRAAAHTKEQAMPIAKTPRGVCNVEAGLSEQMRKS